MPTPTDLEVAEKLLARGGRTGESEFLTPNDCRCLQNELARLRRLVPGPSIVEAGDADPAVAARFGPVHQELMEAVGEVTTALPGAIARVPDDRAGFWVAHEQCFCAWAAADRLADLARNLGDQLMQRTQDLLKGRLCQMQADAAALLREEASVN